MADQYMNNVQWGRIQELAKPVYREISASSSQERDMDFEQIQREMIAI